MSKYHLRIKVRIHSPHGESIPSQVCYFNEGDPIAFTGFGTFYLSTDGTRYEYCIDKRFYFEANQTKQREDAMN